MMLGKVGIWCEKRIPKHGDENVNRSAPSRLATLTVKKESPNMGTKGRLV